MIMFKKLQNKIRNFLIDSDYRSVDWILIVAILLVTFFGLVMISSVGVAIGLQKHNDLYWYFKHQITSGVLPGLLGFVFFYFFNYERLKKYAPAMLFISIFLLVLVFIPGIGAPWGSAKSWIHIFGFSLQPSEIVKLTFLIYLSAWLANKEDHHLKNPSYGFFPFIIILSVIAGLLILEPDTGTMLVIVVMSLAVYFAAGGSLFHIFWLGVSGFLGLILLISANPDSHRAKRLITFLHPELDPRGIGYHINQALLAVGSGGWLGRGYGRSRQKFSYLPQVEGDSIFAVIAEELGFILSACLVFAYLFIAVRGLKMASGVSNQFGKLLATGIIVWLVAQAFINISAIIGLVPLTGITLPFISHGGTSMAISLSAVGILANISKNSSFK